MFSSRTSIVSQLIFNSFNHLEFIFLYGVSRYLNFIFLHVAVHISQNHLLNSLFYSILCFFPLCQIVIDCRDLGLFLGSLFCSIGLSAYFYASTNCFDYSGLVIPFDIRYCDPSYFVLLSQNCRSYSGSAGKSQTFHATISSPICPLKQGT